MRIASKEDVLSEFNRAKPDRENVIPAFEIACLTDLQIASRGSFQGTACQCAPVWHLLFFSLRSSRYECALISGDLVVLATDGFLSGRAIRVHNLVYFAWEVHSLVEGLASCGNSYDTVRDRARFAGNQTAR